MSRRGRVVMILVVAFVAMATCAFADGAKRRGPDERKGNARDRRGRVERQNPSPPSQHAQPREQQQNRANRDVGRRDSDSRPRYQRERRFQHYHYRNFNPGDRRHYFLQRPQPWSVHRSYRRHLIAPHVRLWYPIDRRWFYWPYEFWPERGCGWYWVPTMQYPELEFDGTPVFGYEGWHYLYLCID